MTYGRDRFISDWNARNSWVKSYLAELDFEKGNRGRACLGVSWLSWVRGSDLRKIRIISTHYCHPLWQWWKCVTFYRFGIGALNVVGGLARVI